LNRSSILIISDDPEFARTAASCWQTERRAPEVTLASSDVWHPAIVAGYTVVIIGPVREGRAQAILAALDGAPATAVFSVASDERTAAALEAEHPHFTFLPLQDRWTTTLSAISREAFRRIEAVSRAQRAERLALENQNYATLGRYMLDMRSNVNNALTSVLGNADLLMLDADAARGVSREQIQTIHTMALRLNEIMQRFSSLASEVRLNEKGSQAETEGVAEHLAGRR
jgi:signal transduction histidine kinase